MPQFMLALYDDPTGWTKLSPEEMQQAIQKYSEWRTRPYTRASQRLGADTGRVIRKHNGTPRAGDGPYSETKEVLGGFYVIEARDYDEAVKLALDHPHAQYGTIEVRKLWEPPTA